MTEEKILITIGTKWSAYKQYLEKEESFEISAGFFSHYKRTWINTGQNAKVTPKPTFEGFMEFIAKDIKKKGQRANSNNK